MEIKNIESLIKLLNESDLTVLEVQEGDLRIRIEKKKDVVIKQQSEYVSNGNMDTRAIAEVEEIGHKVISPLVGNFYASISPSEPPFVKVGQAVTEGQVICIVEAMKVMNEIVAPVSGVVRVINAQNGAVVEFGQVLLVIE
ncbi:acetyl CoA carboxylase [Erysipelotrichaceae bacterium]|nr:acetyl CoA carboxylase [Erysipelotrichaceae bacterium]